MKKILAVIFTMCVFLFTNAVSNAATVADHVTQQKCTSATEKIDTGYCKSEILENVTTTKSCDKCGCCQCKKSCSCCDKCNCGCKEGKACSCCDKKCNCDCKKEKTSSCCADKCSCKCKSKANKKCKCKKGCKAKSKK